MASGGAFVRFRSEPWFAHGSIWTPSSDCYLPSRTSYLDALFSQAALRAPTYVLGLILGLVVTTDSI